jgi:hypothetical protein
VVLEHFQFGPRQAVDCLKADRGPARRSACEQAASVAGVDEGVFSNRIVILSAAKNPAGDAKRFRGTDTPMDSSLLMNVVGPVALGSTGILPVGSEHVPDARATQTAETSTTVHGRSTKEQAFVCRLRMTGGEGFEDTP